MHHQFTTQGGMSIGSALRNVHFYNTFTQSHMNFMLTKKSAFLKKLLHCN